MLNVWIEDCRTEYYSDQVSSKKWRLRCMALAVSAFGYKSIPGYGRATANSY